MAGGIRSIARSIGNAVGLGKRLVPGGADDQAQTTKVVRTIGTAGEEKRRRRRWLVKRGRQAEPEARPEERGHVPRDPRGRQRKLEAEVARLEAELERLYSAIADGGVAPGAPPEAGGPSLEELVRESRELRERLHEKRLELARLERHLTRDELLRPPRSVDPVDAAADDSELPRAAGRGATPDRRPHDAVAHRAVAKALDRASFEDRKQRIVFERAAERLVDADPETRCEAAALLGELAHPLARELLVTATEDPSEIVRVAALNALARIGHQSAVGVFRRFLHDGNGQLRLAALRGLANVDSDLATAELAAALDDEDAAVRKGAAGILGWRAADEAIPPLVFALGDGDEVVRVVAAESLGRVRDDRAVFALIRAIADPSPRVVEAALGSLRAIVGSEVDTIAEGADPADRVAALKEWWKEARPRGGVERRLGPEVAGEPPKREVVAEAAVGKVADVPKEPAATQPGPSAIEKALEAVGASLEESPGGPETQEGEEEFESLFAEEPGDTAGISAGEPVFDGPAVGEPASAPPAVGDAAESEDYLPLLDGDEAGERGGAEKAPGSAVPASGSVGARAGKSGEGPPNRG